MTQRTFGLFLCMLSLHAASAEARVRKCGASVTYSTGCTTATPSAPVPKPIPDTVKKLPERARTLVTMLKESFNNKLRAELEALQLQYANVGNYDDAKAVQSYLATLPKPTDTPKPPSDDKPQPTEHKQETVDLLPPAPTRSEVDAKIDALFAAVKKNLSMK